LTLGGARRRPGAALCLIAGRARNQAIHAGFPRSKLLSKPPLLRAGRDIRMFGLPLGALDAAMPSPAKRSLAHPLLCGVRCPRWEANGSGSSPGPPGKAKPV